MFSNRHIASGALRRKAFVPELGFSRILPSLPIPTAPESRRRGRPPSAGRTNGPDSVAERSERIILAARDLLEEDGLEGLTIRAVLTRTGLSRRAFYERFAGKDDLVLAVFDHSLRWAAEYFTQQVSGIASPIERLHFIVVSIANAQGEPGGTPDPGATQRSAALCREHLRLAESRPNDLQAALAPLLDLLAHTLADGMDTGEVRRASPEKLATLVYNLVATTVHSQLLAAEQGGKDMGSDADMAREIWEFCRRAISV